MLREKSDEDIGNEFGALTVRIEGRVVDSALHADAM
jgi:hypothetical protein